MGSDCRRRRLHYGPLDDDAGGRVPRKHSVKAPVKRRRIGDEGLAAVSVHGRGGNSAVSARRVECPVLGARRARRREVVTGKDRLRWRCKRVTPS
jgi:hypothetical protein